MVGDRMLSIKMDRKCHDSRDLDMHLVFQQPSTGLMGTDVACIKVLLDLIFVLPKLHCSSVMAIVYVLVNVLDCPHIESELHIDMTVKL